MSMSNLHEVKIHRLHPTQITVGMVEVRDKRAQLAKLHGEELRDFMSTHPIPAVEGPDDKLYITDHHHLATFRRKNDILKSGHAPAQKMPLLELGTARQSAS